MTYCIEGRLPTVAINQFGLGIRLHKVIIIKYAWLKIIFTYDNITWVSPSSETTLVDGVLSIDDSPWIAYKRRAGIQYAKYTHEQLWKSGSCLSLKRMHVIYYLTISRLRLGDYKLIFTSPWNNLFGASTFLEVQFWIIGDLECDIQSRARVPRQGIFSHACIRWYCNNTYNVPLHEIDVCFFLSFQILN